MKYILILWIVVNNQPLSMTTAEFYSKESCVDALQDIKRHPYFDTKSVHGACVKK